MKSLLVAILFAVNAMASTVVMAEASAPAQIDFSLLPSFQKPPYLATEDESLVGVHLDPKRRIQPELKGLDYNRGGTTITQVAGGTGSRGGGSGVLATDASGVESVKVLDVFRSEHRELFPLFYEIDRLFYQTSSLLPSDQAAELILAMVTQRIEAKLPGLAKRLAAVERNLPFSKWTPAQATLPLIDDYIGDLGQGMTATHVQLASRRGVQVVYDEALFARLDGLNRAALRLHERVYAAAGNRSSAQTQRLVSFLMSGDFFKVELTEKMIRELDVESLIYPDPFQAMEKYGVHRTTKAPSASETCGSIESLNVNGVGDFELELEVDPKHPQLSGSDIVPVRRAKLNFAKRETLKLTRAERLPYAVADYMLLVIQDTEFPLYLNPVRLFGRRIICFETATRRLSSVEDVVIFHRRKTESERRSAELESAYFAAHRALALAPSDENRQAFDDAERALRKHKKKHDALDVDEMIWEFEYLGGNRVIFPRTPLVN